MRARFTRAAYAILCALALLPAIASTHPTAYAQGRGGGRGAQPDPQDAGGAGQPAGGAGRRGFGRANTPTFPGPPAGMSALPTDLFTSRNFYKDKEFWSDKRYFRCNTPRQITDIWTSRRIGNSPPASASWGACTEDYPRQKIVSPYPYK